MYSSIPTILIAASMNFAMYFKEKGTSDRNIEVKASFAKQSFKLDDKIAINVVFKNNTEKKLYLKNTEKGTLEFYRRDILFEFDNKKVALKKEFKENWASLGNDRYLTVEPKGKLEHVIYIDRYYDFPGPSKYKVQFNFNVGYRYKDDDEDSYRMVPQEYKLEMEISN